MANSFGFIFNSEQYLGLHFRRMEISQKAIFIASAGPLCLVEAQITSMKLAKTIILGLILCALLYAIYEGIVKTGKQRQLARMPFAGITAAKIRKIQIRNELGQYTLISDQAKAIFADADTLSFVHCLSQSSRTFRE